MKKERKTKMDRNSAGIGLDKNVDRSNECEVEVASNTKLLTEMVRNLTKEM